MALIQVDEHPPPPVDVAYEVPPPVNSPPKKTKKKRDATTLRKAPQGKQNRMRNKRSKPVVVIT